VLNFLALVWLMKRFLYKPILTAIERREKLVAAELADAAATRAESKKTSDAFQLKSADFDRQRAALLKQATEESKTERLRLLEEARKAADALRTARQATLASEARGLSDTLTRRTQAEVFAIARKTLAALASESLETRMAEVFTRHLRGMAGTDRERLGAALTAAPGPARLRSAFALPSEQRATIQAALNEVFATEVRVEFESGPELVSGIELVADGLKVSWSIGAYLESLSEVVTGLLKEQEKSEAKAT
jgi:F-type H+-transporting ATPase subunit b